MRKYLSTRRDFLKKAAAFTAAGALAACTTPPTAAPGATQAPGATTAPTKPAATVKEVAPGVPRNQCLILENPTGTALPADDFNRWRGTSNTYSTGLQQIGLRCAVVYRPRRGRRRRMG